MKILISLFLCVCSIISRGQTAKPIDELIEAEKKFASTALEKGTKIAFIENLSDEGILFKRGIVNGKKFWQEVPEGNDKLTWEPQFADISIGENFGYTTGPFQQYQNRTDSQPAGGGHYLSVWQKKNEKWEVLFDGGIGHQPADVSAWEKASSIKTVKSNIPVDQAKEEIRTLEIKLQESIMQKGAAAFNDYISTEVRMLRPMKAPYRKNTVDQLFAEADKKFSYELPAEIRMAPAGDMAFSYGNVGIEISRDGNTRQLRGNYIRIWKKENGKSWKIVVDMISL